MLFLYDIEPEIIFIFHSRHVIEMKVYVSRAISITLIHGTYTLYRNNSIKLYAQCNFKLGSFKFIKMYLLSTFQTSNIELLIPKIKT